MHSSESSTTLMRHSHRRVGRWNCSVLTLSFFSRSCSVLPREQKDLYTKSKLTYDQLNSREHECRRIRSERASQIETQEEKIANAETQVNDLEQTAVRRKQELVKEKTTLENLQKAYEKLKASQPHASDAEARAASLANDNERKRHRMEVIAQRQLVAEKTSAKTQATTELSIAQQQLSALKATPVDSAKLRLERMDRGSRQGTIDHDSAIIRRLRSEGKLKDHMKVWGPLLAELSIRDADPAVAAQVAVYVENVIPKKWAAVSNTRDEMQSVIGACLRFDSLLLLTLLTVLCVVCTGVGGG